MNHTRIVYHGYKSALTEKRGRAEWIGKDQFRKWRTIMNRWAKILSLVLAAMLLLAAMPLALAEEDQYSDEPSELVILLDCSKSLADKDPRMLRLEAFHCFVDLLDMENARISVVTFGYKDAADAKGFADVGGILLFGGQLTGGGVEQQKNAVVGFVFFKMRRHFFGNVFYVLYGKPQHLGKLVIAYGIACGKEDGFNGLFDIALVGKGLRDRSVLFFFHDGLYKSFRNLTYEF